jgi:broad specificity phosphatase PhoE
MPANRIHLVRHGEVYNPRGVLYGRLPKFTLSDLGHEMAAIAAEELKSQGAKVTRLLASPLQRTMESAKPIAERFNVAIESDEAIIEPYNHFEGHPVNFKTFLTKPHFLLRLTNPSRPSWGEPFEEIASRMLQAMERAWLETPSGDVVMVSHQLPIWMVHQKTNNKKLPHDPRSRRCELSSITSFSFEDGLFREVGYVDAAKALRSKAVDRGAV